MHALLFQNIWTLQINKEELHMHIRRKSWPPSTVLCMGIYSSEKTYAQRKKKDNSA